MSTITMKELLGSRVHFGHQAKRWNAKMKKYIFGERNGIITSSTSRRRSSCSRKRTISSAHLRPASDILSWHARSRHRTPSPNEAKRWRHVLYFEPLARRHAHQLRYHQKEHRSLKKIEKMKEDGTYDKLTKKRSTPRERAHKTRKILCGIKTMPASRHSYSSSIRATNRSPCRKRTGSAFPW